MVVIHQCLWFLQVKHKLLLAFATATGRERDFGTGTTLVNVVDVMVTPYNQMKLVLNRHMLTDRVFLIDPTYVRSCVLRPFSRTLLAQTSDVTLMCSRRIFTKSYEW